MGFTVRHHLPPANRGAEIVGEPTAGTNGNCNWFTLPGGHKATWTGIEVLKHDGSQHHGVGILPTVAVSPTIAGLPSPGGSGFGFLGARRTSPLSQVLAKPCTVPPPR